MESRGDDAREDAPGEPAGEPGGEPGGREGRAAARGDSDGDGDARLPLRRLFALARPERGLIVGATSALLVGSLAGLAYPQALRVLIDDLARADPRALDRDVAAMLAIVAVQSVAVALRMFLFGKAGERIVARLRERVFGALLEQEVGFFDGRRTGELVSRLAADTTVIQSTVTVHVSMTLRNALMALGALPLMLAISVELSLWMLAVVPPIALGAVWVGRRIERLSRRVQDALAASSSAAEEAIGGIRTVRVFNREDTERERYANAVWRTYALARRRVASVAGFVGVSFFASFAALSAVLWIGLRHVLEGAMSGGDLAAFVMYGATAAFSIAGLGETWAEVMRARGAASRVFGLLDREPALPLRGGRRLAACEGRVEFRDVHYRYASRPEIAVLDGVDLVIEPGQVVALVGPSGAGKSTVAGLLARHDDPQRGAVLVDGVDVRELDPRWLREQLGFVTQEPVLFSTTVAENIRYGARRRDDGGGSEGEPGEESRDRAREAERDVDREEADTTPATPAMPAATDAEIEAAARAANAHDFIVALPDGYATQVGERGIQLSGGQRQRVAIARALLEDPRILVLDEATSSLDTESEALVKEALDRLVRARTSLVIAHRLSTVRDADLVLVMDAGRIVERGTHEELMALDGLYRRLVERQFAD